MTYYVLAGGSDREYESYTQQLSRTVQGWLPDSPKVLSCQFAKNEESWREVFQDWQPMFRQYFGDDMESQLATPEHFLDQVAWADVVYLHGGTTKNLQDLISHYENLEDHFKGKVVIGSSAGTNILSKTYFSPKQNQVGRGLGIVPVNTIVHFGALDDGEVSLTKDEWDDVVKRMQAVVGDEEIIRIPEGEFVVIEQ